MSSGATLFSSPGSRLSRAESSTYAAGNLGVSLQDAATQLPKTFSDLNTQLIRTHEGMRRLLVRCDVVGQAVQRCVDALGGTEAAHSAAAADTSSSSVDTSASAAAAPTPAAATAAQRQLCWSLSQYHTHLAQLLSTASLRAYDAAVCDKIVNRLTLMERGASAVQRSVADAPALCSGGEEAAAVVQGSARQLELLARTRFAAAYESFLLYAVATLGDFCALWGTAAQRSGEAVVWSSGKEGTSPMVAPLHAEQRTLSKSKKTSSAVVENRAAKNSAVSESKKRRSSGSSELTADLATALHAVEELRDAVFAYVRLLHATIHSFSNAATALVNVLAAAEIGTLDEIVADSVARIQLLDEALTHAQTSMATRRACYESMFEDGVVQPLRQLQADSKKGVRFDMLVEAVNYPLMEKTSTALERALRRLTEPRRDKFASRRASRSSSDVSIPSSPLEVLFGAWCKTTELCVQIGAEVSEEFTQRVCV